MQFIEILNKYITMGLFDFGDKNELKRMAEEVFTITDSLTTELDSTYKNGELILQLLYSMRNKIEAMDRKAASMGENKTASVMVNMGGRMQPYPVFRLCLQGLLNDFARMM